MSRLASDGGGGRNRSERLGAGKCYRASVSRAASDGGGHCRGASIRSTGKRDCGGRTGLLC